MVSRTSQFLALLESIQQAYAILRDIRFTVSEMRKILWHDNDLCRMIKNNRLTGG